MSSPMDDARAVPQISTASRRQAFQFDERKDKTWLSPISMSKLQAAVKAKRKTVVLNGYEFNITYGLSVHLKTTGEDRELIKLKRKDGVMAPFGYVSVDRILRFQFEDDDD